MLIYLASPYSHPNPEIRQARYEAVLNMTEKLIMRFELIVYSPIVHNHNIALIAEEKGELRTEWEFWSKFDTKMLSRCDEMWIYMLEGWKESTGVNAEMVEAKKLSIKIKYIDDSLKAIHNINFV